MDSTKNFVLDIKYKFLIKDLGLNLNEILKAARLPGDLFSKKDPVITTKEYMRFWNAIEKQSKDPAFPIKVAKAFNVEAFNPPIFAAFCSSNASICFKRLAKFKRLIGPMVFEISESAEYLELEIKCLDEEHPLPKFSIATEMVFLINLIRMATREDINPIKIVTRYNLDFKGYEEFFKIKPEKGKKDVLILSKEDSNIPFLSENNDMWQFLEPAFEKRLSELEVDDTYSARVRSALIEILPTGQSSIEDVSNKLGISKRTLQRNLKKENTTFQKQLNHTRELLARHYLTQSDISCEEISFLIGYDDPNSFARAFHLWTGQTPGNVREKSLS